VPYSNWQIYVGIFKGYKGWSTNICDTEDEPNSANQNTNLSMPNTSMYYITTHIHTHAQHCIHILHKNMGLCMHMAYYILAFPITCCGTLFTQNVHIKITVSKVGAVNTAPYMDSNNKHSSFLTSSVGILAQLDFKLALNSSSFTLPL